MTGLNDMRHRGLTRIEPASIADRIIISLSIVFICWHLMQFALS